MRMLTTRRSRYGFWTVVDIEAAVILADYLPDELSARDIMQQYYAIYENTAQNNPALTMLDNLTYKPTQGAN